MNKVLLGTARYEKKGNDLFWSFNYYDSDVADFYRLHWQGYDDAYWWTEVEHTDRIQVIEVNKVKKAFEIDHETNEVYLLQD